MAHGVAWSTLRNSRPLSGFAHGAAGIAWALLKLAGVTGEDRFHQAALGGIAYERSLFSREAGNWLDLRDHLQSGQDVFSTAWCHGAPGIGLARLSTLDRLDDAEVRAEIDAALRTTAASGPGGNHSLCHGQLGNLEVFLQASLMRYGPEWSGQVNRFAGFALESIRQNGWRCGNPVAVESPGLMPGLAGIGYGLLRLAEPERVPSVLLLAPPR
jgi:lantibiotic modifying enzyme